MIRITGTLAVKTIKGSRGLFAVGELQTEVGTFKVKDQILDQYEPGRYEGEFLVSRIYPSSYIVGGRAVIEVRAEIQSVFLNTHDDTPVPEVPVIEPDPLDELSSPPTLSSAEKSQPELPKSIAHLSDAELLAELSPSDADVDAKLFGAELFAIVQARGVVKLDPTVDRANFRLQRDRLKALGYRFDAAGQDWILQ